MIRSSHRKGLAVLFLSTALACPALADQGLRRALNCHDWAVLSDNLEGLERACDSQNVSLLRSDLEKAFQSSVIRPTGPVATTVEEDEEIERTTCLRQVDGRFMPPAGHYIVWRNYTTDRWVRFANQDADATEVDRARREALDRIQSLMSSNQMQCLYGDGSEEPSYNATYNVRLFTYSTDGNETLNLGVEIGSSSAMEDSIKADLCAYSRSLAQAENPGSGEECPEIEPAEGADAAQQAQADPAEGTSDDEGEDNGTSTRDGSGDGVLPPAAPPWVSNLAQIILKSYGLQEYAQFGALALMMVAPDLLEELAAFSAELTEGLANDDLDAVMEALHEAYKIGSALGSLQESYNEIAGAEGFREIVATTAQEIQNMPAELREQLSHVLNEDAERIVTAAGALATLEDPEGFLDAVFSDDQSYDRLAEIATEQIGAAVEDAIIDATITAVQDQVGISLDPDLMRSLYYGDAELSAENVGRQLLQSVASEADLSPDDIDAIIDGRIRDVAQRKVEDAAGAFLLDQIRAAGGDPALTALVAGAIREDAPPGTALLNAAVAALPPDLRGPAAQLAQQDVDSNELTAAAQHIARSALTDTIGGAAANALLDADPVLAAEEASLDVVRRALPPGAIPPGARLANLPELAKDAALESVADDNLRRELRVAAATGRVSEGLVRLGQAALAESLAERSSALDEQILAVFRGLPDALQIDTSPTESDAFGKTTKLLMEAQDARDLNGVVSLLKSPALVSATEALLSALPADGARHRVVAALRDGNLEEARISVLPLLGDAETLRDLVASLAGDALADELATSPAARALLGPSAANSMAAELMAGDADALLAQLSVRENAILAEIDAPLLNAGLARLRRAAEDSEAPGSEAREAILLEIEQYGRHMREVGGPLDPRPNGLRSLLAYAGRSDPQIEAAFEGDLRIAFGDWLVRTTVETGAQRLAEDAALAYLPPDIAEASFLVLNGTAGPDALASAALGDARAGAALAGILSGDTSASWAFAEATLREDLPAPIVAVLLRPLPVPLDAATAVRTEAALAVAMVVRQHLDTAADMLSPRLALSVSGPAAERAMDELTPAERDNLGALILAPDPQRAALIALWPDDPALASAFGSWVANTLRSAGLEDERLIYDALAATLETTDPEVADALRQPSQRGNALAAIGDPSPGAVTASLVDALGRDDTGIALLLAQTLPAFRNALLSQVVARGVIDAAAAEADRQGIGPEAAKLLSGLDPVAALQSPDARAIFAETLSENVSDMADRALEKARAEAASLISVVLSSDPVELVLERIPEPYRSVLREIVAGGDVSSASQTAAVSLLSDSIGLEAAVFAVDVAAGWLFGTQAPTPAETEAAALAILRNALLEEDELPPEVTRSADLLEIEDIEALLAAAAEAGVEDLALGLLATALDDGTRPNAYLRGVVERHVDAAIVDGGLPSLEAALLPVLQTYQRVFEDSPEPALRRIASAVSVGPFMRAAEALGPNDLRRAVEVLEAGGNIQAASLVQLANVGRLDAGWRVTARRTEPASTATALVLLALASLPEAEILLGSEGQELLRSLAADGSDMSDATASLAAAITETPVRARIKAARAQWVGLRQALLANTIPADLLAYLDAAATEGTPVPRDRHHAARAALSTVGVGGDLATELLAGQPASLGLAAAQDLNAAAVAPPRLPASELPPSRVLADLLRPLVAAKVSNASTEVPANALAAVRASLASRLPNEGIECIEECLNEALSLLEPILEREEGLAWLTGDQSERNRAADSALTALYCRADAVIETETSCRWNRAARMTVRGLQTQSVAALGSQRDMDDLFLNDFVAPTERRKRIVQSEADNRADAALQRLVECTRPDASDDATRLLPPTDALNALLPQIEALGTSAARPLQADVADFQERRNFMARFETMSDLARQCLALGLAGEALCVRCLPVEDAGAGLPTLPIALGKACRPLLTELRDEARDRPQVPDRSANPANISARERLCE